MKRSTLTVHEVAEYLGVSPDKIYMMVREKAIPCFRIGSRILLKKAAIDSWIEKQIEESMTADEY
nr:helix-turn-helix domain-containing protein [Lentibacillus populi]